LASPHEKFSTGAETKHWPTGKQDFALPYRLTLFSLDLK
jgi:hypothetical protein